MCIIKSRTVESEWSGPVRLYAGYLVGERDKHMKKKLWKIAVPLLLIAASFILLDVTRKNPELAEYGFARGLYKYYAILWSSLTQWVPFSLMELGIVLSPFLTVFLLAWVIVHRRRWRRYILIVLWTVSIVFLWLTCTCNVNYNRYSFAQISGLTIQDSGTEELYQLCLRLAGEANAYRALLANEDEDGAMKLTEASVYELSKTARSAYQKLNEEYQVFDYRTANTKPIFFSRLMSYTDLVGVYCPLTMETNVNTDVADYSIPSSMCHELAHFFGFMREDEANFIGYLACLYSDSIEFRYSGTLLALIHAGNQLADVDMDAYNELWSHYSEGVVRDLKQNSEYWKQFKETAVSEVSTTINDAYLKANHQTDGVRSYGRMVDLLLAYYRE